MEKEQNIAGFYCTAKIGYTCGVYGCSGEVYLIDYTVDGKPERMTVYANLYKNFEIEVREILEKKNYKWNNMNRICSELIQFKKKEAKYMHSEKEAIEILSKI